MSNIKISKTDEKLFNKLLPDNKLTHFFKTKNGNLKIAVFDENKFIAIESPKAMNIFKETILDQYDNFIVEKQQTISNPDGSTKLLLYMGNINE